MDVSKLFKYLIPIDIKSLSKKERCYSILLYIVPFLLFCLVLSISANDFSFMILWGLYCILLFPWFFYLLSYERLERKYKILSDIRKDRPVLIKCQLAAWHIPAPGSAVKTSLITAQRQFQEKKLQDRMIVKCFPVRRKFRHLFLFQIVQIFPFHQSNHSGGP